MNMLSNTELELAYSAFVEAGGRPDYDAWLGMVELNNRVLSRTFKHGDIIVTNEVPGLFVKIAGITPAGDRYFGYGLVPQTQTLPRDVTGNTFRNLDVTRILDIIKGA